MPEQHQLTTKSFMSWLGTERRLITGVAATSLASLAFIAVADETMEGETQHVDEAILRALRTPGNLEDPVGPDWLLHAAQDVSALGGVAIIVLIVLAVCGYFLLKRKAHTMLFLLASIGGGTAANFLLKEFFSRPRPSVVPHLTSVTDTAFPSGHSMLSAILYLTIAAMLARSTTSLLLKGYFLVVACMLVVLIGASRVFLGVHYPTDVLAGWCAGVAFAAFTYVLAAWMQRRGAVERASEPAAGEQQVGRSAEA